ncbi:MAG: DUF305 domain-containing protein [Methylobacterium sp.]|uniref:CopM family metallochaperone n=1 Tax=Methylobacterium sp. TaxID=409 RepID=UPI0025F29BDA|nr:DUF305 domain-containing protein [Methylobacterium sp.]MBX9930012.1 DUF305 domain-containing protein [Methylobacterium sp.]
MKAKIASTFLIGTAIVLSFSSPSSILAQGTHHGHGGMHDHGPKAGDTPATKAFKEADAAMMRDMAVPYTGDPDVDFRTHMIPHHLGAVAMARVALAHAKDAQTKAMAQKIIDDQEREIAEMRAWLKAKGR